MKKLYRSRPSFNCFTETLIVLSLIVVMANPLSAQLFELDVMASNNLIAVANGSVAWGDYDNDGDLDILLTGDRSADGNHDMISFIYRNDGGNFTNINAGLTGVGFRSSAAWGDYNNDNDLDILLTGLPADAPSVSELWGYSPGICPVSKLSQSLQFGNHYPIPTARNSECSIGSVQPHRPKGNNTGQSAAVCRL